MNKARRLRLAKAYGYLDAAMDIVRSAKYDEQDALNNLPESFEDTDRYKTMDEAVDALEDAETALREAKAYIETAVNC